MNQKTLFSLQESLEAKTNGMQVAEDNAADPLELARSIARRLARENGETNADAVGAILFNQHGIKSLGPAAGSVFKGNEWVFTGKRVQSTRVKNHARELKVWRLK